MKTLTRDGWSAAPRGATIALLLILVAGLLIYAACLFKNISYPLMWADESMTAMGAERVLHFGYPKVHDGRNVFYDLRAADPTLGIDKPTDAYIGGAGWTQYYFAAPFALLARLSSDDYVKTAILRIPFALAGLAGLLVLLWTGARALPTRLGRLALAATFIVLELPSITLMLHLREVRYYSLQLLMSAVALGLFAAYHIYGAVRFRTYAAAVVCLLPLLFLTFSPAAAAFYVAIFLYLAGEWFVSKVVGRKGESVSDRHSTREELVSFIPVLASLVLVSPLLWFFRTLYISRSLEEFYHFTLSAYWEHVEVVWGYFARYDVFVFAVAAKLLLAFFWRKARTDAGMRPALRLSLLLSVFFVAQALLVGKVPNPMFTRYFIPLQPVLVLVLTLDLAVIVRAALGMDGWRRQWGIAMAAILLIGSIGWAFYQNRLLIKGRLYEVTHQYRGVLDYIIPYLQERYPHPERLLIATNYEETSYGYYLGCRTTVGFLPENLPQDLMERPDCIIYRSYWAQLTDPRPFDYLYRWSRYEAVRFPVYDYGVNNIPETVHWTPVWGWQPVAEPTLRAFRIEELTQPWELQLQHYFGTATTWIPQYQATIYLRQDASAHKAAAQ